MPTSVWIVLVAITVLGLLVASLGSRLRSLPLSEPLLALVAGLLLGPQVAGWLTVPAITEDPRLLHEIASFLLAVSVMAIALRYRFAEARSRGVPVGLLLAVVLPLMALAGAGVVAIAGLGVGLALVLGCAMCPTDPVLSSSVVTGGPAERDLPARTRQLLSLESGANDGLALPLVLVALAVAGTSTAGEMALAVTREVGGALLLGALAGLAAAAAIRAGERYGMADGASVVIFTIVLAIGVLALAQLCHVGGILAVFVAGLVVNARQTTDDRLRETQVDEAVNRFAVLPFFLLLGASLPWGEWQRIGWPVLAVAVGVLLLRRLPWLLLAARPLRLRWRDAVFLGWFGPIGVSAIFYLTEAAEELGVRSDQALTVLAYGVAAVAMSTWVHGMTSSLGRKAYVAAQRHART